MEAVREALRCAGGGQLMEAVRALSVVDLCGLGLATARAGGLLAEARAGDGLAEAAARGFEKPLPTSSSSSSSSPKWKLSTRTLLPSFSGSSSKLLSRPTPLSSTRAYTTWLLPQDLDNLPKLPPISELSYDKGNCSPEIWIPFLEYLKLYHEPFPDPPADRDFPRSLSTDRFREMQRDLLKLVAINRKRGYDLADDLVPNNVLVCIGTGRIRLEHVSGNLITSPTHFKGYQAVGTLLHKILSILYHGQKLISEDNFHFHTLLASSLDDERILNDASLLSRFGRLGLTVRISMLVENDLQKLVPNARNHQLYRFFESLPYTCSDLDLYPTDEMDDFFKDWRKESTDFKDQDRTLERNYLKNVAKKDPRKVWIAITGRWLIRMNRNGVMHPPKGFTQFEAIDLLHSKTALYLQEAQKGFWLRTGWWAELEMRNYFAEKK